VACWISTVANLTCLFSQSEPEIDYFEFCVFPRVFPMHTKDLVDLLHAQLVINMMTSIFKLKPEHVITFKKKKTICAKNQSRKIMMKTKSFSNGK
jgi:hypothetical protein